MGRVADIDRTKTGGHMPRLCFAVVALAFGFSTTVLAQTPSTEQQAACKADYQKYCKGTVPGGGRIVACLNQQRDRLSDACKKAIDSRKQ
jgi:hypothetical protein